MDVGQGFDWLNFLSKKLLSGAIRTTDYNLALYVVNTDFFQLKTGLPQEYQPGKPFPRQAYEVSIKITDDIKHLRKYDDIPLVNNLFNNPKDYAAFSSMRYPYYKKQKGKDVLEWRTIDVLTDEDYNQRLESKLLKATLKSPFSSYLNGGWEVQPVDVTNIRLTYLRFPNTPFAKFDIVKDQPVYNPNGSVQLDWPITVQSDFFIALCKYFQIYLNAPDIWQMIGERAKTGQP